MATDTKESLRLSTSSATVNPSDVKPVEQQRYTREQEEYLGNLQKRLESAATARDSSRDEFDGMDYLRYYEENAKLVNSFISPKKNRADTSFTTGSPRQKLMAVLSNLNRNNFTATIRAYNEAQRFLRDESRALDVIREVCDDKDNDDEKKMLRQYELVSQGTVFVEEDWGCVYKNRKKLKKLLENLPYQEQNYLKSGQWTDDIQKVFEGPVRNVLYGPNVYLGDMGTYEMNDQPYIFTVHVVPYAQAESIFRKFDKWKLVPKNMKQFSPSTNTQKGLMYSGTWSLTAVQEDMVEIIKYQDDYNDEFQVICNGVLMLPIGHPMPWAYDGYSIVKQTYEVIHPHFAYGKSLMSRLRSSSNLLDEMWKLALLKTQKSFMPARVNNTGQILSAKSFYPGQVVYGIEASQVQPIDPEGSRGVNQSEFNMISLLQGNVDQNSVDPTVQGQSAEGQQTATEIVTVQRQAEIMLDITEFVATLLEQKLGERRYANILSNWFEPLGKKPDGSPDYRTASISGPIEGGGFGDYVVELLEELPYESPTLDGPHPVYDEEEAAAKAGQPMRKIYLNPKAARDMKLRWKIVVEPIERGTSTKKKIMLRAMMADAFQFFGNSVNLDYLKDKFAAAWDMDSSKLFSEPQPVAQGMPGEAQMPGQAMPAPKLANPKVPGMGSPNAQG